MRSILALLAVSMATLAFATAAGADPEPAVRGPSEAKPKTTVTFAASGFAPNTELGVVLSPTRERNDRGPGFHDCLKGFKKEFRSDDSGEAAIRFRFPRNCTYVSGATGREIPKFWKNGQRVDVRVFDTGDLEIYAIKVVRVVKSSSRKPVVIPTTNRHAIFEAVCELSRRCKAKVTIKAGNKTFARGGYSVPAGKSRRVRLGLTKAGRKKLSRSKRVKAKATITDKRTGKSKSFPVVLRGRG